MPAAQPLSAIADVFDTKIVPELDRLVQDLGLGPSYGRADVRYNDLEARWQQIVAIGTAAFRGKPGPVNPPRWHSADGTKAVW